MRESIDSTANAIPNTLQVTRESIGYAWLIEETPFRTLRKSFYLRTAQVEALVRSDMKARLIKRRVA